ncbi:hypothetical protein L6J37_09100 [Photobacterium sp. WH77]|uniref:hypothetical protein n=1 Tax=unclassified Photobacterium TaxID=2628852 RepID=UPI001EDA4D14|nr:MULTISPECIES: hypothetical protein [unclassified Photobacterium]MCG2836985.1 hypothetical protein [Photobacterium sp. WH77]MCG2844406.1 hypothetical protein [Photobacterium sp. WH80]
MINNLSLSKNVQFYVLNKALTKKSIQDTFKEISKERVGNYLLNDQKISYITASGNQVVYSILSYKIEVEPSFLTGTSVKEKKYAYLLLIECDDALAILKKYVDSPEKHFSSFIEEFDYEKFCHFHGDKNPEYERVTMKNMSISNAVIRSRSLEAKSLNGIISSNSSSRSIPSNFRMKVGDDSYTLTPSTSRVSNRDKKSAYDELIDWVVEIKNEIKVTTNQSEFLSNFASPICLKEIIDLGHQVVAILIDLSEIENKVSDGIAVLNREDGSQLNGKEINRLFNQLKSPILVDGNFLKVKGSTLSGKISYSKKLITIRNNILDGIFVNENGSESYTLGRYINKEKPFSAVFDSPNYSYYSRSCFEDKHLINNIQSILNIFDDGYDFSGTLSEKEKPHAANLTRFPANSLFRKVEDQYCASHDIVICDDMNDEWSDHIAIDSKSAIPSISFIHSKFTIKDTYGASAFHDVVAQALKNIGRTQAEKQLFKNKYDNDWHKNYESTNINRVSGALNWRDIELALDKVNQNPNAIKKIVLATPFLSKAKLAGELNKLTSGQKCKPHYVQLIWLINTFISSCKDFGVQAHILCKP